MAKRYKVGMVRAGVSCAFVLACLFLTPRAAQANDPTTECPIHPLFNAGRTDPLGTWIDAGLRCTSAPWDLQFGLRYTGVPQSTLPFVAFTYERQLLPNWDLIVTASSRDHAGDYEANRMPEVTLLWAPPASRSIILPSVSLSAGYIQAIQPGTQTTREGGQATLSTPTFRLLGVDLGVNYTFGDYTYGTGQSSNFWIGTATATFYPFRATQIAFTYLYQQGFGTSPLVYDFIGLDQYLIGQVGVTLSPAAVISLSTTFNIPTQPVPVRDVILSWSRPSESWSVGVRWHQADGHLYLTGTFP